VDNLSHTLAGLLLAECAVALSSARRTPAPARSPHFRALALFGSALANNFPDFDFVYSGVTGGPLGYLLHHRGHTHTLPVALLLGGITFGAAWLIGRRTVSRDELRWLAALCFSGPLVHIAMDFSNNYGVHPFWPVYDGWFYGDAVFILEPFFWAVAIPALVFSARTIVGRVVLALVLLAALGASVALPFIPRASAAALILVSLAMTAACAAARHHVRLALAVFGSSIVAAGFFLASARAKAILRDTVPASDAILDLIVTPMPANPLCFDAWILVTSGETYVARRAVIGPVAGIVPASRCPVDPGGPPTAPLTGAPASTRGDLRWRGAFVAPVSELRELASRNCRAAAFLRYARAPYWTHASDGRLIVGDLRYDRNPGLDFADLVVAREGDDELPCPAAVPPWTPPRRDMLETGHATSAR
jgi:inner membrane protein